MSDITLHKGIVPLLCITIVFAVLTGNMFNIALPQIAFEFGLLPSGVSFVVTGYILLFAISSMVFGRLADRYPIKYLIIIGLIIFNIGAVLGFISWSYQSLLVARYIQACGAGAIPALAMLLATRFFPPERRGRLLGYTAASVAFGAGTGPIIGGFIIAWFGWRSLFLFTSVTLLTLYAYYKWLPVRKPQASTAKKPFLPLFLLRDKRYLTAMIATFLCFGSMFATMFMLPLLLGKAHLLDSEKIGMVMFPGAMSAAILASYGGRLADKKGSLFVNYLGMTLLASGVLLLSIFAGAKTVLITAALIVAYVGFSFVQSSMANTVSRVTPVEHTGAGMGFYNFVSFLSGSVITSIVGFFLDFNSTTIVLNPLFKMYFFAPAIIYSNVAIALFMLVCLAIFVFYKVFNNRLI